MLGTLIPNKHVYIYGAGFAGLSFAYRLKKLNIPFTIYEKEKIGGKISTHMTSFGPAEAAASTLYMNADAEKFLEEIGLPYIVANKKLKRWIWKKDGPASPMTLKLLARLLLKAPSRFPQITEESTVEDVFLPLLSRKYIDELLSPALQGIHGAEARDLHFLSIFPMARGKKFTSYIDFIRSLKKDIKKDAAIKIKGSVSFNGGMQTLIDRLHNEVFEHIKPLPDHFVLQPNTVICTTADEAANLLMNSEPVIAKELHNIEYRPITSLSFFLQNDLAGLKKSFGMLIPQKYGCSILGIIHQSEVFPQNYTAHCYSAVCKGTLDEKMIFTQMKHILKDFEEEKVLKCSLSSWKTGLPLYNNKRSQAVQAISRILEKKPGLMLFGNYTNGISLRSMIGQIKSIPFSKK